ncbi:MAG: tetratricopeptide repeat protein, partial [Myxococcota bacterium]
LWRIVLEAGRKFEALQHLQAVYTYERALPDSRRLNEVLGGLASAHLRLGQLDEATKWLEQAIEGARAHEGDPIRTELRVRLAEVHVLASDWRRVLVTLDSLADDCTGDTEMGLLVMIETYSGGAAYLLGHPEDALRRMDRAVAIARDQGGPTEVFGTTAFRGAVRRAVGHPLASEDLEVCAELGRTVRGPLAELRPLVAPDATPSTLALEHPASRLLAAIIEHDR